MLRYAEAYPNDLDDAWRRDAPAIVPIGALEWHGEHLPFGVDLVLAERFAERLAESVGGVLLPALVVPITCLPHPHSLSVPTVAARSVWEAYARGLIGSGARRVLFMSGHYAQGHVVELYRLAQRLTREGPARVWAGSPLEPLGDDKLDHAARWETAQMLVWQPELVRESAPSEAILGESPALATAMEGEAALDEAAARWASLLEMGSSELLGWLALREEAYADYTRAYGSSGWEAGILAWWADRRASKGLSRSPE